MKYRKLDENGDFSSRTGFLIDSPEAVAQAIKTRIALLKDEWILDTSVGMPWQQSVVGKHQAREYDYAIREIILNTKGVKEILSYSSSVVDRILSVSADVDTIYGIANVTV